jgi:hypothetical protein
MTERSCASRGLPSLSADIPSVDRSGDHVVAIIGCRASQRALDEINASGHDAFAGLRTFWLMPADRSFDPEMLREWNARYPGQPAMFIHDNAAWTNVETDAMPHFQRFRGEQRIASLRGWERGAGLAQLKPLENPTD